VLVAVLYVDTDSRVHGCDREVAGVRPGHRHDGLGPARGEDAGHVRDPGHDPAAELRIDVVDHGAAVDARVGRAATAPLVDRRSTEQVQVLAVLEVLHLGHAGTSWLKGMNAFRVRLKFCLYSPRFRE